MSRYTNYDFENLVQSFAIPYHERTLGQLFCDLSAKDIIKMFNQLIEDLSITIQLKTASAISKVKDKYVVTCKNNKYH